MSEMAYVESGDIIEIQEENPVQGRQNAPQTLCQVLEASTELRGGRGAAPTGGQVPGPILHSQGTHSGLTGQVAQPGFPVFGNGQEMGHLVTARRLLGLWDLRVHSGVFPEHLLRLREVIL